MAKELKKNIMEKLFAGEVLRMTEDVYNVLKEEDMLYGEPAYRCPRCGKIEVEWGNPQDIRPTWIYGQYKYGDKYVVFIEEDIHEFVGEFLCPDCEAEAKKETMRPDSLLQGSIYSHGLATGFAGHKSALEIEQAINTFEDIEGEVCVSWKTQKIGGFGLFIRGEVTIASNMDLWSTLSDSGERVFDPEDYRANGLFTTREELDLTQWDHTEFFIRRPKIVAIWCKDWFYQSNQEVRDLVARLRNAGHKVYIVGKRH